MIASLVATLDRNIAELPDTVRQLSQVPGAEIGDLSDYSHRIPVLVDSPDPGSLEETTRLLQQIPGVAFVDVVFVHFEDEPN